MGDLRQELGAAQRGVEAFAGEGIVEAGRVADQGHSVHARLGHAIGERAHGHERTRRAQSGEARGQMAELLEPRREEDVEPPAIGLDMRQRHHQAQVRDARPPPD